MAAWSVLETYLCCGVIFGWPNLKKIFIEENVFCIDDTAALSLLQSNETSIDITATVSSAETISTTIETTTMTSLQNETLGMVPKNLDLKIVSKMELKNQWKP